MTKSRESLLNESIINLLIKFSAPAMVGMMVNALYNLVDTIFVGKGVGTLAITALAVAFPIQMVMMAIAQTVGIGSASIISRALGAGDKERADEVVGGAIALNLVSTLIFVILGLLFLNPLLRLFGASETVLPYAREYMQVIFVGMVFFAFSMSSNNFIRAEGNAKMAMYSMILGAVSNMILDPILIFGFKMGVQGAAIATVISQILSSIFIILYFTSGKSALALRLKDIHIKVKLSREIIKVGSASFARQISGSILSMIINNSLLYYGGDMAIAIMGVSMRLLMFLVMPIFGIVQGFQPIVGFNYGARQFGRVKEALKVASLFATGYVFIGFLVIMIWPQVMLGVFSNDVELIQAGVTPLRIMNVFLPLIGFQALAASLFQAIGKSKPALILTMSRQIIFFIPLVLILPLFFKLTGVWMATPGADLLSFIVTGIWVMKEMQLLDQQQEKEMGDYDPALNEG